MGRRCNCALAAAMVLAACRDEPSRPAVAGPIRHDQLSAEQLSRITKVQETFREVDPTPLSKWVDDFKRDRDPDREIRVYEGMARAYTAYGSTRTLSLDAKREVYGIVLQRSAAPDDEVLKQLKLVELSTEDAKAILKLYDTPPAPITVAPTP